MIWLVLTGIVAVIVYYYLARPLRYWSERGVKQTNPILLFGDTLYRVLGTQSNANFIRWLYNLYPGSRYMGFYLFNKPVLLMTDTELIKQITVKDFDYFTDHRIIIDPEADPFWDKNLFALRGQPWREMRVTLSGSFTSSKMKIMFGLIKEASENFVQYFLNKEEKLIEVEMKNTFTRYTNDVIATTAFGIKVDSMNDPNNEFFLMGKDAADFTGFWKNLKLFTAVFMPKYLKKKMSFFSHKFRNFFTKLIHDSIKTREELGIVRPDMLHILLEARKGTKHLEENNVIDTGFAIAEESSETGKKAKPHRTITNDDITSQALIFFFAGFESVSTLMSFLAYELAVNQVIQQKLRAEIKKTSEECQGNLTYETLIKMKYMDMVVSEALRKWPPFLVVDRVCTKPYTIEPVAADEKPVKMEVGDVLWLPIFGIHRDPDYYEDPEKFDPERFSDENKDNIRPYTYYPFGVGPRNCIGSRFSLLETKAVFFSLLSNFEIVPTAKSKIPLELHKRSFTFQAENGLQFGLKRI